MKPKSPIRSYNAKVVGKPHVPTSKDPNGDTTKSTTKPKRGN